MSPTYKWKGVDISGKSCHGATPSSSEVTLKNHLLEMGIALQSYKEVKNKKQIPIQTLTIFFQDFSTLINSGIPIKQALLLIKEETTSKQLKISIATLDADLSNGNSLSDAMKKQKTIPNLLTHLVECGQNSGRLNEALQNIATYLNRRQLLLARLKSSTIAPLLTLFFSLMIVLGILLFLIPQLTPFLTKNTEIGILTKAMISTSSFLQSEWNRLIIVATLISILGLIKTTKQIYTEQIIHHIPIVGKIAAQSAILHFLQTLALLTKTGYPIKQGLLLAQKQFSSNAITKQIKKIIISLEQGNSLYKAFSSLSQPMLNKQVLSLINIGEQTGNLDQMLEKSCAIVETQLLRKTEFITTLLQPILLVIVGLFIALLLISIYLPLFSIFT